jgi:homogentisate 1,2-dioxygenase
MDREWNFFAPSSAGQFARQAHVNLPDGTFERELGRSGFYGPVTHMFHRNPPTAWTEVAGDTRPRAFDSTVVAQTDTPWASPEILHNDHVSISMWKPAGNMRRLVRNSDGDDLLFVHRGGGEFFSDYGHLSLGAGDYLLIPHGTMWRLDPLAGTEILRVESTRASYRLPERGLIGQSTQFDVGMLDRPELDDAFTQQDRTGSWPVDVKRRQRITTVTYPFNPLDAVGWQGDLYPVRVNIRDIRPVSSHSIHLPPSAQTTFVSDRFVVCSLVPKPVESEPGIMKLPFFHNNDDYDEVVFFHEGLMRSRAAGIGPGGMTVHPRGITHGPNPATLPQMLETDARMSTSYSVMIDSTDPLDVGDIPAGCELPEYVDSWRDSIAYAPDAPHHLPA